MFETTASLPIYPALTDSQVELICDAVKRSVKP
jgi:dTDP-4-amino-4,6-dideoxygalactose transaminase